VAQGGSRLGGGNTENYKRQVKLPAQANKQTHKHQSNAKNIPGSERGDL
jgi:hypothetical protein